VVLNLTLDRDSDPLADAGRNPAVAPRRSAEEASNEGMVVRGRDQILTHAKSRCRFHAYRVKAPLVQGMVLPLSPAYDIGARLSEWWTIEGSRRSTSARTRPRCADPDPNLHLREFKASQTMDKTPRWARRDRGGNEVESEPARTPT
jgi:hypothetical protein